MSLSTFSYVIGVVELLVGIPLIVSTDGTIKVIKKLMSEEALMRFMGAILVILGFLVLNQNAQIGKDVAGLMRLVAWLTAIKGLVYCWWPARMSAKANKWFAMPVVRFVSGLVVVVFGMLFVYAGNLLA